MRWVWIVLVMARASGAACVEQPMSRPVVAFQARMAPIEALVDFGRAAGICFGVEALDERLLRARIDVDLRAATSREVISAILAPAPGMEAAEVDGVVLIRLRSGRRTSWLDFPIPRFELQRTNLQWANVRLHMALVSAADPATGGFAGSLLGVDHEHLVGPIDEQGLTIRQLLNRIARGSRGAAWIVFGPGAYRDSVPKSTFWRMVEYTQPPHVIRGTIAGLSPAL